MILANTHISPLFSTMQQSDTLSNTPFWVIPAVIIVALIVVILLSIYDNEDSDDDAHDDHHHEPEVAETAVIAEDQAEKSVEMVGSTNEDAPAVEEDAEPVTPVEIVEEVKEVEEVEEPVEMVESTNEDAVEVEETAVIPEPEEPEPVVPDNLRKIEGIGPKISGILNDAGIFTFAQLAASSVAHLEKVVREDAGIRIAHPGTWPEQAQFAADGEWDALTAFQDSLTGGRHA